MNPGFMCHKVPAGQRAGTEDKRTAEVCFDHSASQRNRPSGIPPLTNTIQPEAAVIPLEKKPRPQQGAFVVGVE